MPPWLAVVAVALCLALTLSACIFGRSRGPRVLGYRHGTIHLTGERRVTIGAVPSAWRLQSRGGPTLSFRHGPSGALLTINTWCGPAFEDLPLPNLIGQLYLGIPLVQSLASGGFTLDGREAWRDRSLRNLDGVLVDCDAVVVKKNGCSFDFLLTAPHGRDGGVRADFESIFRGFHYW